MNSIKHIVFYPHPAEQVWQYLTQPELLKQWIAYFDKFWSTRLKKLEALLDTKQGK